jgi:hypothetical protein
MLSTKDDAMSQAIEHLRARVEAVGGTLTAARESRDCYHLVASLPQDGQRETLILRWDPDRREPTFFFQGREYLPPENADA